jgi:hypothetical protein
MRAFAIFLLLLSLSFLCSVPALANTCNSFATYSCSNGTPNVVNLTGTGSTGQSVGILLGSNTFGISVNGKSVVGDDLILLAAFPNGMSGSVNGVSFSSVSSFPEGSAIGFHNNQWTGAIPSTWSGMGIAYSGVALGYANLGTIGNGTISITASGVPNGTILYAEVVNPTTGKILYITPNSEAGILNVGAATTPEPGTLTLLGSGLIGLASLARRKYGKG